jgi:hypothetical protein
LIAKAFVRRCVDDLSVCGVNFDDLRTTDIQEQLNGELVRLCA